MCKRLLVRFKDRNPQSLGRLEALYEMSHHDAVAAAREVEARQHHLVAHNNALACVASLLVVLIALRFGLGRDERVLLEAALQPSTASGLDGHTAAKDPLIGWEECADAALSHLLRTSLARQDKPGVRDASAPPVLTMPKDTQRLQRHLALVCDRFLKGPKRASTAPACPQRKPTHVPV